MEKSLMVIDFSMYRQGVAPLDIVRNKNAKNVLFAQGQMTTGRAIEMRIGEMARNPGRATPLILGSPGML
jgi:hypothetical protein